MPVNDVNSIRKLLILGNGWFVGKIPLAYIGRHSCSGAILDEEDFGPNCPPIAYVGDTIADIQTILNAKKLYPSQRFISIGVTPPHLKTTENVQKQSEYESKLKASGADLIIESVIDLKKIHKALFKA